MLGVFVGGGIAGIVLGLLARWFDPCVGPTRFEPCSDDPMDSSMPCYMGICDVWRPDWYEGLQLAAAIALIAAAGFLGAWVAARWQRVVGAFAALFAMLAAAAVKAFLFPHFSWGPEAIVNSGEDAAIAILFAVLVGAIGFCGGWMARSIFRP